MDQPDFLTWEIVAALHRRSLERWGGMDGVRDRAGAEAALGAAEHAFFYGTSDLHEIGAAYAFHLAECQAFLDGNKRTAAVCAGTFLEYNGCVDRSDDRELYEAMIAISAGQLDKAGLASCCGCSSRARLAVDGAEAIACGPHQRGPKRRVKFSATWVARVSRGTPRSS
ncbi:MAG: type II toxin-antitoxin system death-on-curing family toxin, partial [Verrucomicrobia bacterium]|nr:type II toxin-antitoxin system death-on-curing family toxin [Verrucomicrobiota bacterium]